jgi:SOS-response transcriptional repressor LexA
MLVDPIPEEVRRFITANIASVEDLEILRILGTDRNREWSVPALAREVQASPQAVAAHLATLENRGLLRLLRGTELTCRFGPTIPEQAPLLERLLAFYNERPVTLIRMVYSLPPNTLQTLADAFRIRKDG